MVYIFTLAEVSELACRERVSQTIQQVLLTSASDTSVSTDSGCCKVISGVMLFLGDRKGSSALPNQTWNRMLLSKQDRPVHALVPEAPLTVCLRLAFNSSELLFSCWSFETGLRVGQAGFPMQLRSSLNSWPSCLYLLRAGTLMPPPASVFISAKALNFLPLTPMLRAQRLLP